MMASAQAKRQIRVNAEHTQTVQGYLRKVGWPLEVDGVAGPQTRAAIEQFQRGYGYSRLPRDGKCAEGSNTFYRLRRAAEDGGHTTAHFVFGEWKSKGGTRWVKLNRYLVIALEQYRAKLGESVTIVSGYRSPSHNRNVGGATCSWHTDACGHDGGSAADIIPRRSVAWVRSLGLFRGIGYDRATGLVRHVDLGPTRSWQYGLRAALPFVSTVPDRKVEVYPVDSIE